MPRAISRGLLVIAGVLLCAVALLRYAELRRFQAEENRRLELALHASLPSKAKLEPPALSVPLQKPAGSLVGRIEIPRLKLSAIVLEGSDDKTLRLGVGRVPETAEPGSTGNVVLAAHRDTLFRPLRGIHPGDEITITTPKGTFRYTVDWMEVVNPENTEPLKSTPEPALTLVTCYPFHYIGPAPQRFIVRARQASSPETDAHSTPSPTISASASTAKQRIPLRANTGSPSPRPKLVRVSRSLKRPLRATKLRHAQALRKDRAKQRQPAPTFKHFLWRRSPKS